VIHNGVLLPLLGSIVVGLTLGGGLLARALSSSVMVFLGNASYAMYILHVPIPSWMSLNLWERVFGRLAGLQGLAICCMAVIVVSCIIFKVGEVPLNRILKRKLEPWLITQKP
jgi:peptidoglycan/LPS O-acetylase OafA/YrhL